VCVCRCFHQSYRREKKKIHKKKKRENKKNQTLTDLVLSLSIHFRIKCIIHNNINFYLPFFICPDSLPPPCLKLNSKSNNNNEKRKTTHISVASHLFSLAFLLASSHALASERLSCPLAPHPPPDHLSPI